MNPPLLSGHTTPVHFDLGLETLATSYDLSHIPHEWQHPGLSHHHMASNALPSDTHSLQVWAASLDLPGI
ncbi:MAG: hypothetical protein KDC39_14970 [Actinobacteria bacterium]|nr:hypothetical protein [Actinomycetota bacterium]